jgi:hypothetical protein
MTEKITTPTLEKVKTAVKEFEATQRKYRDYGALDSEPDGVWHRLLINTLAGKAPTPPRDGHGWELYASSMDCSEAADALFEAALHAIRAIESCAIKDLAPLQEYLRDYCWRCH